MADSPSTSALATPEAVLLDGANGVTNASRQHFPDATLMLAIAAVVAVAVRWIRRPALVAALLLGASIPGFVHVLALRGDAPLARPKAAAAITTTVSDLQAKVPWPGTPVKVVHEEDDVLFPLGRYAVPGRVEPQGAAVELELGLGLLGSTCVEQPPRVTCGARP